MSKIRIFTKIFGSFLLGIICVLFFAQEDPWVKSRIQEIIDQGLSDLHCQRRQLTVKRVNFFRPSITVDACICEDAKWKLSIGSAEISSSWFSFFTHGYFASKITLYKAEIYSEYTRSQLALYKPLYDFLMTPSHIPIRITSVLCKASIAHVKDMSTDFTVIFYFGGEIGYHKKQLYASFSCEDGIVRTTDIEYARGWKGTLGYKHAQQPSLSLSLGCDVLFDTHHKMLIIGSLGPEKSAVQIHSVDKDILIQLNNITMGPEAYSADIAAHLPLARIAPHLHKRLRLEEAAALNATAHVAYDMHDITYTGQASATHLYPTNLLIDATFQGTNKQCEGSYQLQSDQHKASAGGSWSVDAQTDLKAHIEAKLHEVLSLGAMTVEPDQTHLQVEYSKGAWQVEYGLKLRNPRSDHARIVGKCSVIDSVISCVGTVNDNTYKIEGNTKTGAYTGVIRDKIGKVLQETQVLRQQQAANTIDIGMLKKILGFFDIDISGSGTVICSVETERPLVRIGLTLKDAALRVPYIYNIIQQGSCEIVINTDDSSCVISHLRIVLQEGTITGSSLTVSMHDAGGFSIHIPLIFDHCVINWQKELFGELSGYITLVHSPLNPGALSGHLWLDRSYFRGNPLAVQSPISGSFAPLHTYTGYFKDMAFNIKVDTQSDVEVKTPFFNTKAQAHLALTGTIHAPLIHGTVNLVQGSLEFPFKPLYITRGVVYLTPDTLTDPLIELEAQNRIKNYALSLSVTGTAQHPQMNFSSQPTLLEEQIITLLLAGSDKGSLLVAMPSMIMQKLENLVFGTAESSNKVQRYLKSIFKPLKHVRITPTVSDEAGLLNPAVEFDITDKLHGKVKNLTDPQIELAYEVTDDVTLKAAKDEQGALSGELQMKWKF